MGNKQDTTTKFSGWFCYGSDCQEVTPREVRGSHSDITPCLLVNSYQIFGEALLTPPTGYFFPPGATQPIVGVYFTALYRALASSRTRLLDHTQRRATVGRAPLNE